MLEELADENGRPSNGPVRLRHQMPSLPGLGNYEVSTSPTKIAPNPPTMRQSVSEPIELHPHDDEHRTCILVTGANRYKYLHTDHCPIN